MLSANNNYDYNEREKKVLELYNHGKSTRHIAKELRMSLRDIRFVVTPGLGRATPIMQSRVTIAANCSSLQPSVPAGRTGSTRKPVLRG
jgi:orotate phosphoribosyltransferase-like protein